jgi:hypothetical protein
LNIIVGRTISLQENAMRLVIAGLVVALASPVQAADEDKAKAVVGEFLKALKDKDLDGVMKTVDVPFAFDMGRDDPKTITKADELKALMTKLLEGAVSEKVKALEMGKAYDMAGVAKYFKDEQKIKPGEAEKFIEQAEKLVGKSGYMVLLVGAKGREIPGVFVRIKDGKAVIASVPQ